jgi:hypothetical protein
MQLQVPLQVPNQVHLIKSIVNTMYHLKVKVVMKVID